MSGAAPVPVLDALDAPELRADAYLLDVWGVLWDGVGPYPEAAACLAELRRLGRPVVLLSNAPRRPEEVARGLARIGFGPGLHDGIVSSGGLCREALARGADGAEGLGRAYHYLGLPKDRGLLDGLPFREAPPAEADFVLNLGTRALGDAPGAYLDELRAARDRELPMVCANPDRIIVRRDGTRIACAGALADAYAELGGKVIAFGKPHRPAYGRCVARLRELAPGLRPERILAVGDSLETDIRGAGAAGLRTALVAGGVHAGELGCAGRGGRPDPALLARLVGRTGIRPDAALAAFRWRAEGRQAPPTPTAPSAGTTSGTAGGRGARSSGSRRR